MPFTVLLWILDLPILPLIWPGFYKSEKMEKHWNFFPFSRWFTLQNTVIWLCPTHIMPSLLACVIVSATPSLLPLVFWGRVPFGALRMCAQSLEHVRAQIPRTTHYVRSTRWPGDEVPQVTIRQHRIAMHVLRHMYGYLVCWSRCPDGHVEIHQLTSILEHLWCESSS